MLANCIVCGKEFNRTANQKACSQACRDRRDSIEIGRCKWCGVGFSREGTGKGKKTTCGDDCRKAFRNAYKKGYAQLIHMQAYSKEYARTHGMARRAAQRLGIPRILYASLKVIHQFDQLTETNR